MDRWLYADLWYLTVPGGDAEYPVTDSDDEWALEQIRNCHNPQQEFATL